MTMKIICPECGKPHKLTGDRLPDRKFTAKCKQCGAAMIIDPLPPPGEAERSAGDIPIPAPTANPVEYDIPLNDGDEKDQEPPIDSAEAATGGNDGLFGAFPGLRDLSPDKFAYHEIFARPGRHGFGTGENRLLRKLVEAVHQLLTTELLADDEKVLRIARGIAYHPFEIPYANGLLTMLSNYYAIVCTDRRLLLINVDRRLRRPTRYIFQIPYGEIAGIGRGLFRSALIITGKSGRNWNFTTVNRNLAARLEDFVAAQLKHPPAIPAAMQSPAQLCPSCHTPLEGGLASCPHCGATFKTPGEALLRSLILPGLGSIYLGYLPLGITELTVYPFCWLLTVALLVFEVPGAIAVAVIPVAACHLAAGLLARKTAAKGYLLDELPVAAAPGDNGAVKT
ncbi:MAG: hypothetical protein P1P81_07990 [Desulfobulbales bacterium]|nr:hypothetical protein [Desulfobulbales bacterium]